MPTIGYYSMTNGQGLASQVNEITNNGDIAVNVTVPNAAQLASLDALYVVNPSNSGFGAEYLSNLGNISAAVNNGMKLIIFDRTVTNANIILPGGSTITPVRDFASATDINVAAGAPTAFTNGANGVITDATFDGGNFSNHGYVELSSLPPGSTALLTTSDPTHIVAFTYPVGSGNVFYSTIPLDFYTGSSNAAITPAEILTLFGNTLDVICFARGTLIQTATGLRCVEQLVVGDQIAVMGGGTQPIRWIGSTKVSGAELRQTPALRPIRITAGALGNGLPSRDLSVSRQHRILVSSKIAARMFGTSEVLVSAIKLIALPGIYVDDSVEEVEYFHILFDNHEIIWAENTTCESLFTGPQALQSVPPAARAELFTLFPELQSLDYAARSAALIPSGKSQRKLVGRHLKNNKMLVGQHLRPTIARQDGQAVAVESAP